MRKRVDSAMVVAVTSIVFLNIAINPIVHVMKSTKLTILLDVIFDTTLAILFATSVIYSGETISFFVLGSILLPFVGMTVSLTHFLEYILAINVKEESKKASEDFSPSKRGSC